MRCLNLEDITGDGGAGCMAFVCGRREKEMLATLAMPMRIRIAHFISQAKCYTDTP